MLGEACFWAVRNEQAGLGGQRNQAVLKRLGCWLLCSVQEHLEETGTRLHSTTQTSSPWACLMSCPVSNDQPHKVTHFSHLAQLFAYIGLICVQLIYEVREEEHIRRLQPS